MGISTSPFINVHFTKMVENLPAIFPPTFLNCYSVIDGYFYIRLAGIVHVNTIGCIERRFHGVIEAQIALKIKEEKVCLVGSCPHLIPQIDNQGVTKMTIKKILKKLWKGHKTQKAYVRIHEDLYETEGSQPHHSEPAQNEQVEVEVDLSPQKDLENYARGLSVSKKSLEQLISSGLLMPGELEVAEKIVKFMRENDSDPEPSQ